LQVGHIAVDSALRYLQALGQMRCRGQPAATDGLHDLEQAVSAAHTAFLIKIGLQSTFLMRKQLSNT
jgi:hypothetical protein